MKTLNNLMHRKHQSLRGSERGFTLIELLVGMVLSMLTIVAIYQILTVWDGRRRTITGGSSAQISGSIANFEIERDLQLAGKGLGNVTSKTVGCSVQAFNSRFSTPNFTFTFAPIEIIDGAGGAPDVLRVLYGSSAYSANIQKLQSSTNFEKQLDGRAGYRAGDVFIVAGAQNPPTPRDCAMYEMTAVSPSAGIVEHRTNSYFNFYNSTTVASTLNSGSASPTFSTGEVYNLGPDAQRTQWMVNTTTAVLSRANTLRTDTATFEITEGIVNLQAQYGIDGSDASLPNGRIEATEWTNVQPTDWSKVLAVRVAVLARSNQLEKDNVNLQGEPSWAAGTFTMANLDGTTAAITGINDWRRYRYRVYETVVSLRNMIWGAPL
jgi:type IV pilus assembly protein PilW